MTIKELKEQIENVEAMVKLYENEYGIITNKESYNYRMGELHILEQWLQDLEKESK